MCCHKDRNATEPPRTGLSADMTLASLVKQSTNYKGQSSQTTALAMATSGSFHVIPVDLYIPMKMGIVRSVPIMFLADITYMFP